MSMSMWIAFIICFVLDLVVGLVTDKYSSSLYILLEHIQLITILPLAGSCFSLEVNGFFRLSRYSLLSFDFKQLFYINSDYSQDNSVMNFIGFTSGSTIINIAGYLLIGLCILFVEMIMFKFYKCRYSSSNDSSTNINRYVFKTASRLKIWMPFGAPLRYLLLGVVLVNTAGFDELNNYSDSNHRWSWWLTLFLLFFCTFIFSCTVLYAILSKDYQGLIESNAFSELVNGLKDSKLSKFYSFMFMIHRILILVFFIIDMNICSKSKLIFIICIQSIYLIVLLLVRPFNSIKSNIDKIVSETFILILLSLMLVYRNSSDWSSSVEYVFICIMAASCYIPLVMLCFSTIRLMCCSKKNASISASERKKDKVYNEQSNVGLANNVSANASQIPKSERMKSNFYIPKNHYNYEKPWINKYGDNININNDKIYPQIENTNDDRFKDKYNSNRSHDNDSNILKVGNRKIYLR